MLKIKKIKINSQIKTIYDQTMKMRPTCRSSSKLILYFGFIMGSLRNFLISFLMSWLSLSNKCVSFSISNDGLGHLDLNSLGSWSIATAVHFNRLKLLYTSGNLWFENIFLAVALVSFVANMFNLSKREWNITIARTYKIAESIMLYASYKMIYLFFYNRHASTIKESGKT